VTGVGDRDGGTLTGGADGDVRRGAVTGGTVETGCGRAFEWRRGEVVESHAARARGDDW